MIKKPSALENSFNIKIFNFFKVYNILIFICLYKIIFLHLNYFTIENYDVFYIYFNKMCLVQCGKKIYLDTAQIPLNTLFILLDKTELSIW